MVITVWIRWQRNLHVLYLWETAQLALEAGHQGLRLLESPGCQAGHFFSLSAPRRQSPTLALPLSSQDPSTTKKGRCYIFVNSCKNTKVAWRSLNFNFKFFTVNSQIICIISWINIGCQLHDHWFVCCVACSHKLTFLVGYSKKNCWTKLNCCIVCPEDHGCIWNSILTCY